MVPQAPRTASTVVRASFIEFRVPRRMAYPLKSPLGDRPAVSLCQSYLVSSSSLVKGSVSDPQLSQR